MSRSLHLMVIGLLRGFSVPLAPAAELAPYCGTQQWQPIITDASQRFALPAAWLDAVIRIESAGCDHMDGKPMISSAGALGLMQLMPPIWERFRGQLHLGTDPMNPHDNILAGAGYLRELYDRYGSPGLFAAYHAGPARYEDYLRGLRALPEATLDYLRHVQWTLRVEASTGRLFVRSHTHNASFDVQQHPPPQGTVFVPLAHRDRPNETPSPEPSDEPDE